MHPCPHHTNVLATHPSIGQCIHAQDFRPCYQPIHWPVHPCPNHTNVHATNPSIGQGIHDQTIYQRVFPRKNIVVFFVCSLRCAYHHNGNAMLSNGARVSAPLGFPNIARSRSERTHCAEPGLKPPSRPATALPCQNQEPRPRRSIESFACFAPHTIITGTPCSTILTCQSMGPAMLFARWSKTNGGNRR